MPALEVRGLVKHYPGVKALDGVDLVVRQNEVLGLAGENGAGKSTLLKALVGLVRPDAGEIWVRGEKVRLRSVVDAANHGIGMVFQEQSWCRTSPRPRTSCSARRGAVSAVGSTAGTPCAARAGAARQDRLPHRPARAHRHPQLRRPADGRDREGAAHRAAQPAPAGDHPRRAHLGAGVEEIETLFTQVRRLREFASVIFVSHRLDEVLDVCDRVVVLRGGQSAGEVPTAGAAPATCTG